ncbi:MAG: glycosyltransferase family 39 protein [Flavobacteriales bacterium]|nr:glycosyltransferase family 39 protein [Flavobacteriales bacterium]
MNNKNTPYYILFILGCLLYVNTVSFDYTLDDKIVITHNQFTKQGFAGISDILSTDLFVGFYGKKKDLVAGGRYRPLSLITFAIEYELFGEVPSISHFFNMLLNALTGPLLLAILFRLFKTEQRKWLLSMPFVICLLFVAHPLHTEVVANIKGRDEILSLLFSFGTLFYTLKFLEERKTKYAIISSILFFLAFLSKENTIIFLAIIPLIIYFLTNKSIKENFIAISPLFIVALGYIIFRYQLLGSPSMGAHGGLMNDPFTGAIPSDKYATILYTLGLYFKLVFIPHPLTHDYYPFHIPIIRWNDARAYISLFTYCFLLIFTLAGIRKKSIYSLSILIFLSGLSLASNFIFPIGTFMNERFMHVALLGGCIVIAHWILNILPKYIKDPILQSKIQIGILVIIMIGLSGKTIARNYAWESDHSLFMTDVVTSPNSAKVNMSAGASMIELARNTEDLEQKRIAIDKAIGYLERSIEIYPTYSNSWLLHGNALYEIGDYKEAVKKYDYAAGIHFNYVDALQNLKHVGELCTSNGQYQVALDSYKALLKFSDNEADIYNRIGRIYGEKMQNIDMALIYFQQGLNKEPNNRGLLDNIGVAYGIKGDNENAIIIFERVLKLRPNDIKVLRNLSAVYFHLGDQEKHLYYLNLVNQLEVNSTSSNQ